MGILSINRNLLSKFKPKSLSSSSSSDLSIFRRIPAAAPPVKTFGDLKPKGKSVFLIDYVYKGITNHSLFRAAAKNNNSWGDHFCSPFSGRPGNYRLVGSCKEWTLFRPDGKDEDENQYGVEYDGSSFHQSQCRLILWNPTTNRLKTLPPSLLPRRQPVFFIGIQGFGFGFDPKSQDYKILCFLEYNYLYSSSCDTGVELYSLKTDSWKQITPSYFGDIPDPYHSVHINGVYYWAGTTNILSFDFADESFSEISLPIRMHIDYYCLAEFHESLAIIIPYWVPAEELTEEEKQNQQPFSIKIWVWNGKTWNLEPRVAVGDFPVGDGFTMLMGLFQNEYLFLQGYNEAQLMLFNCKTGKLENLGIPHESDTTRRPLVFPHEHDTTRMPLVFPYNVSSSPHK